jgi:hypothetical protein
MNERIKELFEQAHITTTRQVIKGGWDNDRPPYEMVSKTTTEFDPEVFAQLIIKECMKELEASKRCDPYTGDLFDCEYNTCLNDQIKVLIDHFGVEE